MFSVIFKDPDSISNGENGRLAEGEVHPVGEFLRTRALMGRPCRVASLLLPARKGDDLQYVGSVGTGFMKNVAIELREMLDKLVSRKPPYGGRRKNVSWRSRR
ncbi:hypothetical protein [Rhizobium indicum]|uniref:ATP dependent DNA ligase n=1 Tax=Rhizobium indicum TaxID=2583231 RepID=UPI001FEF9610|nr:hypothetical protein [Rhizobium indicum]